MRSFSNKLDAALTEAHSSWIDPDRLWTDGAIPFIYTSNAEMFYGSGGDTHGHVMKDNTQLRDRYAGMSFIMVRHAIENDNLVGRVSDTHRLVSFWNRDQSLYENLMADCCQILIHDGIVEQDAEVSTPVHGTVSLSDVAGGILDAIEMDDDEVAMLRQLHLMKGNQKRHALKRLLGYTGSKPNKWQKAMVDAGIIGPGQKWWAPHSESIV